MPRRYLIIGSGVAGVTAAEAIRRHDPSGQITLVGDDPHGYYSRPGLAYYLNRTLPEHQLFHRSHDQLLALRLNYACARVTDVFPEQHDVILGGRHRVRYDRLLLATGATASPADFPGADLAGIVKLDTMDDVRHILRLVRRARDAVVVGGGITAVELAEGLAAHDLLVRYFLRGDRFWSKVLDETESQLVEAGLAAQGIGLHHRTQIARTVGKRGRLVAVETLAGETFPCQVLGVAIGVVPHIELAQRAGLATKRGILVNQYLEASAPDVYAAGDSAEVLDPRTGRTVWEALWPTARAHGEAAGANMVGMKIPYFKDLAFNSLRVGGVITTVIGSVEGADAADTLTLVDGDGGNRVRVIVGQRALIGALVMGDQTLARPLQHLIEAGADITPIRAALAANPTAGIALIAAFYRTWAATSLRQ